MEKQIKKLIEKTHFWRDIGFDELSELYLCMMMRTLALSLIGIFVPIYLYSLGYSLQQIILYAVFVQIFRMPWNILSGLVVGRIGPKHTIALSTIIMVAKLLMLISLGTIGWPLWFIAFLSATTSALFFTAYHTDFSKIKHAEHSGKELGMMTLFERGGAALGPLVGGLIASFYDVRLSILITILLFVGSLVPLFKSGEAVKVHQKIIYRKLNLSRDDKINILILACVSVGFVVVSFTWALYLALTVFTENTYASIGAIVTLSTVLGLVTAKLAGHISDSSRARPMLRAGAALEGALSIARLFVTLPVHAVVHNVLRDQAVMGITMPVIKGFYDIADSYPGRRIAIIVLVETVSNLAKLVGFGVLYLAMVYSDPLQALKYASALGGLFVLAAWWQRMRAVNKT